MMMEKPMNWDSVEAIRGGGKRLTPGGHACKIVSAKVQTSKAGNQMLVIAFDIVGGEFDGYFSGIFNRAKQNSTAEPKWPNSGVYRQVTGGDSMGRFKGMLLNIEESNQGYKWNWDESSLVGKKFGGVFREEEYKANSGDIKTRIVCIGIHAIEGIEDIEVPAIKKLALSGMSAGYPEEEIPF